jgi:hypothetical protein
LNPLEKFTLSYGQPARRLSGFLKFFVSVPPAFYAANYLLDRLKERG